MLKKKWILPMLIILALILTSCTDKPKKDDDLPPEDLNGEENLDNMDDEEIDEDDLNDQGELEDEKNNPDSNTDGLDMSYDDIKITVEEAYKEFTTKFDKARVSEIELERENNSYYYEIEGYDDKNEYELKIDKIIEKASKEVEGDLSVDEWELKIEDGKPVLKIEFKDDNNKQVEHRYDLKTEELIKKD